MNRALNQSLLALAAIFCGVGLTTNSAQAQASLEVEAVAGTPFGVGRVTAVLPQGERIGSLAEAGFTLADKEDRVLYPAFDATPVRTLLRDVLNRPQRVTMYFLFTGDKPLTLSFFSPAATNAVIRPRTDARAHDRMLQIWWREYTNGAQRAARSDQHPTLVDDYLVNMLARRLRLAPPTPRPGLFGGSEASQTLGTLLGAESIRAQMAKETILSGLNLKETADQPLPAAVLPPMPEYAEVKDVAIEPIAMHVPAECLYLRCGNFANYQWFRGTLDRWGGDLRNLVATRGIDYGLNEKMERQISLKENALAKLLGPTVIADVAVIGADTFLREGASIGMLFQAKSNFLLASDIKKQRAATLAANKDATEKTVKIGGRDVSFLSTPDNRVRSFYAVDGDFHLVTTSETIVARFFEAGAGKNSLGGSAEFRHARKVMPLDREDTLFVYLSHAFFANLISPQYRIEMTRRMQAVTDLELLELARWAATAEKRPAGTIDQLVEGGYLPRGFGSRPDGGKIDVTADGALFNSLRGLRGSFLPTADATIERITPSEARSYADFARSFRSEWARLDPAMAAIRRRDTEIKGVEQVTLDLHATPFAKPQLGFVMDMLGPPSTKRVAPIPGDVASLEISSSGALLGRGTPNHIFGGLRDSAVLYEVVEGEIVPVGKVEDKLRWYAGGWPSPGLLSLLGYRSDIAADRAGYSRPKANLFQRDLEGFQAISPQFETLDEVTSQLKLIEAPRPAQVWLYVGDTSEKQVAGMINSLGFSRARQVTIGNQQFLHSLQTQLKVPAAQAMQVAEKLLDAKLVCSLGGKYALVEGERTFTKWLSSAYKGPRGILDMQAPADFQTPTLQWFRGLNLDFAIEGNVLSGHADLMMAHDVSDAKATAKPTPEIPQPAAPDKPKPVDTLPEPKTERLPPPIPDGEKLPTTKREQ